MSENIQREFEKDCREKKNIGHSAAKRVGQRRGCKLPSDYMTKKEKNQLNGEVISMNMNKPMTYLEFQKLSETIQAEYLQNLIDNHGGSITGIAKAFGVVPNTLKSHIYGILGGKVKTVNGHPTRERTEKWKAFLNGEGVAPAQKAPVSLEKPAEATKPIEKDTDTPKQKPMSQEEHEAQAAAVEEWMDKPMTYSAFKTYGKSKQEAYLNRLVFRYEGSVKRIAEMFNIPKGEFYKYLNKRGIDVDERQSENNKKPIDKWLCFLEGIEEPKIATRTVPMLQVISEEPPKFEVIEEEYSCVKNKPEPEVQINNVRFVFGMRGESSLKDIIEYLKKYGLPLNGTVTIEIAV
jgi:hypothetical protein